MKRLPAILLLSVATLALTGGGAAAQTYLATGSFVGDGSEGRSIEGLGFAPDVVIVKGSLGQVAVCRTRAMPAGLAKPLGTGAALAGDLILSLEADGFLLGNGVAVNSNSSNYFWVALQGAPGLLEVGSYLGNGLTDRLVPTGTFDPEGILVLGEGTQQPWFRHANMPPGSSLPLTGGALAPGGITAGLLGGFLVAADDAVNATGVTFHYLAWNHTAGACTGGSYTGDDADDREIGGLGLAPEYLLVKSGADANGVQRPAALLGDKTLGFANTPTFSDGIQALQPDGFQVGTSAEVNAADDTYYWSAFSNPGGQDGADLEAALTSPTTEAAAGDWVPALLVVRNLGPDAAIDVRAQLTLPVELTVLDADWTAGDFTPATGLWTLAGLAAGAADTLELVLQLAVGADRPTTDLAVTVASDGSSDLNGINDVADLAWTVLPTRPDLQLITVPGAAVDALAGDGLRPVLDLMIVNRGDRADTLRALTVSNLTVGSGTQAQLDGEWLALGLDDKVPVYRDTVLPSEIAAYIDGRAFFHDLERIIAPGDTLRLVVSGAPSMTARGDAVLIAGVADAADLEFAQTTVGGGSWPLVSGHRLEMAGFVSDQILLLPVPTDLLPVGSQRTPVLMVKLPANGYLPDVLNRLNVVNHGTAVAGSDLARMEAWLDSDGDFTFDVDSDQRLGAFAFTGDRWELTGLAGNIPLGGAVLFVTVDIAEQALPDGNSVRLGLPTRPDVGVGMASGNDGPQDLPVDNPNPHGISVSDRIILISQWIHDSVTTPAAVDLPLLRLVATNTYAGSQTLQALTVTNTSVGASGATQEQIDGIFRQVTLHLDGDGDGQISGPTVDPVLGSGAFQDGRFDFAGLDLVFPPGEETHLLVVADLGLMTVADGDRLSAGVVQPADVDCAGGTVVATWPLTSGGQWTVDGMIGDQIELNDVGVLPLGPGDGPALALDLTVPTNGYRDDELAGLKLVNTGTAGATDIASLELWRDGGDGAFDAAAGDDQSLGPLTLQDGLWTSSLLSRPLTGDGVRLFVGLTVAAAPQDSATVRLAVPVGGIRTLSGNSGPLDRQVVENGTLVLSTSPLRTSLSFETAATTVGMNSRLRMTVLNAGGEEVTTIAPTLAPTAGDSLLDWGTPTPATLDLIPGAAAEFVWEPVSLLPGTVATQGNAAGTGLTSGLVRRSVVTPSAPHRVYTPVPRIDLYPVTNLPFSINRGQTGIVPLNLTLANPGGADVADGQLISLRLELLQTPMGPAIAPADLLQRIVIGEGTEIYVDRDSLWSEAGPFDLTFLKPARITGSEPITLGLRLDLRADSTVPSFLVSFSDGSWFQVADAVSGNPVALVLGEGTFPLQSGQATLVQQATSMEVSVQAGAVAAAGLGQTGVELGRFELLNVAAEEDPSAIELGELALAFRDSNGSLIADPLTRFPALRLESAFQQHYSGTPTAGSDSLLVLQLSPPALVPGGVPVTLRILVDVAQDAPLGPVILLAGPASTFDARDANTGAAVAVTLAGATEAPPVTLTGAVPELVLAGDGLLPPVVSLGARNVTALTTTLTHPGGVDTAPVRCDSLRLDFYDSGRTLLDPASYLDALRITSGDVSLGYVLDPAAPDGHLTIPLAGPQLAPGTTVGLDVVLDFSASAPRDGFEVVLRAGTLAVRDLVLDLPVPVVVADDGSQSFSSGLTRLVTPAEELTVAGRSLMPPLLAPGIGDAEVLELVLTNPAEPQSGQILLQSLALTAPAGGGDPLPVSAAVAAVRILADGLPWAELTGSGLQDSLLTLVGVQPLAIPAAGAVTLTVRLELTAAPPAGSLSLALPEGGISATRPDDPAAIVHVRPAVGYAFPLVSESGSIAPADLAASYANFPNPFAAGSEATTFVFALDRDAIVSLVIRTPYGEPVATLLDRQDRTAGLHQSDQWNGLNGKGLPVRNGVYLAELSVVYPDGARRRLLRKVAVVR